MSDDASSAGFGKFVPGFDFLQSLAKGAAKSIPQMPTLGGWVAPTLSVEELDKRITELKAVQFWLDQNAAALKATIQALEVQKMTVATLQNMNVSMAEVAKAFTTPPDTAAAAKPAGRRAEAPAPAPAAEAQEDGAEAGPARAAAGMIDAMQWWGALTQQFQQIAASALQEATARARAEPAPEPSAPPAEPQAAAKPARKTAARKRAG
ncbi:PhaM family polyhydroxyalkanoate granule multifunctional regulatory protein [Pseudorhodoferax sp.]|uniref:PhaM family polyhydroxyalkanoate granule multifunctional regulatory protein n=1 Tax=Pseudorhodoferax sp. TaxID=1993553 RepID=UPI0039E51CF1